MSSSEGEPLRSARSSSAWTTEGKLITTRLPVEATATWAPEIPMSASNRSFTSFEKISATPSFVR
jgi:hypothetical protein